LVKVAIGSSIGPTNSKEDSLFKIIILRFEDDLSEEDDTYCIGRAIRKNLVRLETQKRFPVSSDYKHKILSPDHPDKAQKLQEFHEADLLIYGIANKIQEDCSGANMCFRHIVADTIMKNITVPKYVTKINHSFDEPEFITHSDIEQGKLSIDSLSLEAWIASLIALKRNDKEAHFTEIAKMTSDTTNLSNIEKATKFYNQAKVFYNSKNYQETIKSLNKAIELNPEDLKLYRLKGKCNHDLEDHENAIEVYLKLLKINPEDVKANINIGDNFRHLGEIEESLKYFDEAIRIDSNNVVAYRYRGASYSDFNEYDMAILDFSKIIEIKPNNFYAISSRAVSFLKLEEYENAISDSDRALEINPNDHETYCIRAKAYTGIKEYDRAISDFSEAIRLNLNNLKEHYLTLTKL